MKETDGSLKLGKTMGRAGGTEQDTLFPCMRVLWAQQRLLHWAGTQSYYRTLTNQNKTQTGTLLRHYRFEEKDKNRTRT